MDGTAGMGAVGPSGCNRVMEVETVESGRGAPW